MNYNKFSPSTSKMNETIMICVTQNDVEHGLAGGRVRVGAPTRRVDYRTSKLFACQHESLKILSKGQGITI